MPKAKMKHALALELVARATHSSANATPVGFEAFSQLTLRQQAAAIRRGETLRLRAERDGRSSWRACVGCLSGIRPWNQGSDYCDRCIKADRP